MPARLTRLLLPALLLGGTGHASVETDFESILKFGPRVTGSLANEQARTYLETQLRALGYETQRDSFRYVRFDDLGSDVNIAGQVQAGTALQGSAGGTVTGVLVRIPGVGLAEDFARANVKGKIAVVSRGQIPFAQKAQNAQQAGALGVIIVNTEDRPLRGTLGGHNPLPILGVPLSTGEKLTEGQPATLNVRVQNGEVEGQNLVTYKAGVISPEVLFGAHLDSVQGAPGANDNLSGTLSVLELARRAANSPLSARAYFVFFDGEEDGLRGSQHFVQSKTSLIQGLKGMLNLDMVGVNVTPLEVTGDPKLLDITRKVTTAQTPGGTPNGSDHVPFAQAGVPALFFHRGLDANYHQPGDTTLDPKLVQETVDAAWNIAASLLGLQN